MEELMSMIAPAVICFLGWIPGKDTLQIIVIQDGETVNFDHYEQTDEGYCAQGITYEYDARTGMVSRSVTTKSTSCDGPLDRYSDDECHVSALYSVEVGTTWANYTWIEGDGFEVLFPPEYLSEEHKAFDGMMHPEWERVNSYQRDYFAEMMGY